MEGGGASGGASNNWRAAAGVRAVGGIWRAFREGGVAARGEGEGQERPRDESGVKGWIVSKGVESEVKVLAGSGL